jgi:mRNA-degrading endonuclease toxin of MazEF toxin-antitoxin module
LTPGDDGTFEPCVVNAYNLQTVPKEQLRDLITELSPLRMREVRDAIEFAFGFDALL